MGAGSCHAYTFMISFNLCLHLLICHLMHFDAEVDEDEETDAVNGISMFIIYTANKSSMTISFCTIL